MGYGKSDGVADVVQKVMLTFAHRSPFCTNLPHGAYSRSASFSGELGGEKVARIEDRTKGLQGGGVWGGSAWNLSHSTIMVPFPVPFGPIMR
jgi:hypothetical protein